MHKIAVIYIILLLTCLPQKPAAQDNGVLRPADINPPKPSLQKESDEQLAAQYLQNRQYEKAAVLYKKLLETKGHDVYYTYYLLCLVELKDFSEAEKTVRKQARKYPDRLKYQVDLGYVYSSSGDAAKARKHYENVIRDLPAEKSQIIEVANAFFFRGESTYAIDTYLRGRQLIRDYPFNLELAQVYYLMGQFGEMIREYLEWMAYDPSHISLVQHKLQNALGDDPEGEISKILKNSLLLNIQKYPDRVFYSEMLLWLSIQEKDFVMALDQARSIDRRMGENGFRVLDLAGLCTSNAAYDVAIEAYEYVLKKGTSSGLYLDARIGLLNARYLKITGAYDYTPDDLQKLEEEYLGTLEEFGRNPATMTVMRFLGHLQAFYLNKPENAVALLEEAISMPNAPIVEVAECKIELGDILLFTGDVWEATLLYSQVEKALKNDPAGHLAKYRNARLSFYIGEFDWARAQLEVLKAATSKLIANDAMDLALLISDNIGMDSSTVELAMYARADLLFYRNAHDQALTVLDSILQISTWHPIFDDVWFTKAKIQLKSGRTDDAVGSLQKVISDYPSEILADDALFLLATLYEDHYGETGKAMSLYEKILTDYPGSLFTTEARKKFRTLRGDPVN
ncbi:MAG: tetratricopeptide repeat protein [Bacteroidales bacterium]|nr:tetratricopeptide repeat protein [Bacteroidales bacterium]